jgi:glutamate synthase (NADPH/NADH) large chain
MTWKEAYPDIPLGQDACGIIAMAEKSGKPSHRIVRRTLESLYRMAHRAGAIRGEGDGTGIQTDIPRELWAGFLERAGHDPRLAFNPRFFVGHFFVPKGEEGRLPEF